ncbi:MAG: DUF115 domain-containing protein [Turneriella sp.]|nr:DUF115 domain-containing protein [Leptospiraceae bacterium]MCX7632705.1 DUF115 domain-containing protein [Turneriella sp.]
MALAAVAGKLACYHIGYAGGRFTVLADTEKLKGLPLVSLRDPQREAERRLGSFRMRPGMLAVVLGAAHLPLLELLVAQSQAKGGWVLVFEADSALYHELKKLRPDIFEEVIVLLPENMAVMAELVEKIDVENFAGYRTLENAASVTLARTFYRQALTEFKKKLASRFSDLFTRLEFEERWVFNSLSKLPELARMRPVSALFGLGRGAAALLVSTGPSLRHSLPEIRHHSGHYFIACADSAYRVLVRAGIVPQLVLTLDSQAFTAKHFALLPRGKKGHYPILVCDAVSNPQVVRGWQGELCLSFTAQFPDERRVVSPGCDFLEEQGFITGPAGLIPGDLQSGGSVATSLLDLLRLMEFDAIYLVGQDLAYTWREIHAMGTHHSDEWLSRASNRLQPLETINEKILRRRHTQRAKSLSGRPIVTDYILSLYRDWFTNALQLLPNKIFNATYDGLEIPGAAPVAELPHNHEGKNSTILEAFLKQPTLPVSTTRISNFLQRLEAVTHDFSEQAGQEFSFLHYVGRRFALRAQRSPQLAERLLAKRRQRQQHFLRRLAVKLVRPRQHH